MLRWSHGVGIPLLVTGVALVIGCGQRTAAPTAAGASPPAPSGMPVAVGSQAPDFTLSTADGEKIALADLKGQPVVVNFWASWCRFCAQEAPDVEALYQQYRPQGLQVLGVGTDDLGALTKKAKELGLTYPIGSDPETARVYGVTAIPHTFIMDREGQISASLEGARPKADLEAEIRKIL